MRAEQAPQVGEYSGAVNGFFNMPLMPADTKKAACCGSPQPAAVNGDLIATTAGIIERRATIAGSKVKVVVLGLVHSVSEALLQIGDAAAMTP